MSRGNVYVLDPKTNQTVRTTNPERWHAQRADLHRMAVERHTSVVRLVHGAGERMAGIGVRAQGRVIDYWLARTNAERIEQCRLALGPTTSPQTNTEAPRRPQ